MTIVDVLPNVKTAKDVDEGRVLICLQIVYRFIHFMKSLSIP